MDIFNSREISIGIWFFILFIFIMSKAAVRDSLKIVVIAFLNKKILIPFLLMFLYSIVLLYLLQELSLFKSHQIKNFIFWFFSVGALTFFRMNEIAQDSYYFSNAIKDSLKLLIIFQFIVSFYTFDIWLELLFVPLVGFITVMLAFTQLDEEYKTVEKIFTYLIQIIGLIIILFTIYSLITNIGEFVQEKTFYDFVVPTLLSLMILPYFYLLVMYINYETVFIRINFFIKDKNLLRYAKFKSLIKFNFRTMKLKRWADNLVTKNIKSKLDIDNSINEIYKLIALEKNPPVVLEKDGWSPYIAKDFLKDAKLETGYYKHSYDNEWYTSSSYLELDKGVLANNLSYHVEGDAASVKVLKVKLNINEPSINKQSKNILIEVSQLLCLKTIGDNIPNKLKKAILNGKNANLVMKTKKLSVVKEKWLTSGYSIIFIIEVI